MGPIGTLSTRALNFGEASIPYQWGYGVTDHLTAVAAQCEADRFIIVTERTVGALYGKRFSRPLEQLAPVTLEIVDPGDAAKNWRNLSALCESFVRVGATRKTCIVALGGGALGNLAGLAAALTFRGLKLMHVPTTMLAAFDSVISLKQAINSSCGKNHFGTFHTPWRIFADFEVLETLPEREILSGIGEVIKNVLTVSPHAREDLLKHLQPDKRREFEAINWFLDLCIDVKMHLMRDDPRECRRGVLFEYGHTVGHAVEFLDAEKRGSRGVSHGEAVALGMLVASEVSREVLAVDEDLVQQHRDLLHRAGIADRLPPTTHVDAISFGIE